MNLKYFTILNFFNCAFLYLNIFFCFLLFTEVYVQNFVNTEWVEAEVEGVHHLHIQWTPLTPTLSPLFLYRPSLPLATPPSLLPSHHRLVVLHSSQVHSDVTNPLIVAYHNFILRMLWEPFSKLPKFAMNHNTALFLYTECNFQVFAFINSL